MTTDKFIIIRSVRVMIEYQITNLTANIIYFSLF